MNESIQRVTQDYRSSDAPHWRALRDKAKTEGVEPMNSAIAIAWPEDVNVIEGFIVSPKQVFNFELSLGTKASTEPSKGAQVTRWNSASEDQAHEFSGVIAEAKAFLSASR